jgi:Flp pilus assembly protein TadD
LPSALNSASWRVAKSPTEDPADYRIALRRGQEAVTLLPATSGAATRAGYINSVGMAQYRLGQYREALATIAQAAALRPNNPNDQVVSVLIRLKIGQLTSARADLDTLLALKTPTPDQRDLIAEAKALSEGLRKR